MSKLTELFVKRIEQNYEEFREEILELNRETIFDLAMHIAAVTDTFFYLTTEEWLDEDEMLYLLDFSNPLKLVADAWEDFLESGSSEFRSALEDVLNDDDNEENYMTLALERELREKYGEDTNITYALMSEIIETGERYLALHSLYDGLGADDWGEE